MQLMRIQLRIMTRYGFAMWFEHDMHDVVSTLSLRFANDSVCQVAYGGLTCRMCMRRHLQTILMGTSASDFSPFVHASQHETYVSALVRSQITSIEYEYRKSTKVVRSFKAKLEHIFCTCRESTVTATSCTHC
jgi:hypothetical protein